MGDILHATVEVGLLLVQCPNCELCVAAPDGDRFWTPEELRSAMNAPAAGILQCRSCETRVWFDFRNFGALEAVLDAAGRVQDALGGIALQRSQFEALDELWAACREARGFPEDGR